MVRAGIFIGVSQTGGLQRLQDAASGARRMCRWARAQGLDKERAILITDEQEPVTARDIKIAVKKLFEGAGVDQLIVYFAGHGVSIRHSEQWLLSEAPLDRNEAINVSGSVEQGRWCGVRHIVFVSDACRVAPEGIQAQNVDGVEIFPNEIVTSRSMPVDQFFACGLGLPAAELRDPNTAATSYTALYTGALLPALYGEHPELLEPSAEPGDDFLYIKPPRLANHLELEVPRRVVIGGWQNKVNQSPDSIIPSAGIIPAIPNWISRLPRAAQPAPVTETAVESFGPAPTPTPTAKTVARELARSDAVAEIEKKLQEANAAPPAAVRKLARSVENLRNAFGPDHFETECGIKVRGGRIVEWFAPRASAKLLDDGGTLLRLNQVDPPAVSVVLQFEHRLGTIVPAIPGFLTALVFDDGGDLVDVTFEPSAQTSRAHEFRARALELRTLRAVAAASSRYGRFRIERSDAENLARRMQYAKSLDPSLAIYAAYAYHDLQLTDRIAGMSRYLRADFDATFFDLMLLSRQLFDKSVRREDGIVPFVPMLAQGWPLLRANRVVLHRALDGLHEKLADSLWSLYNPAGVAMLKNALLTQEVR